MTEPETAVAEAGTDETAGAAPAVAEPEGASAPWAGTDDLGEAGRLRLAPEPGPANPSPDGTWLAYLRPDAAGGRVLWLQPLAGGAPRPVKLPFTPLAGADPDGEPHADDGPQWSPDGAWLALVGGHPADGRPAVWLVPTGPAGADGIGARLLVDHPAADRGPRWSPDGQTVAFTSRRDGRDGVGVAPREGRGPAVALTDGAQDDRDPAWSREGDRLVFRRRAGEAADAHDLWTVTVATGELNQLTGRPGKVGLGSKPANRRAPRWAPDRALVAYVTDEKGWDDLAVVNPDNGAGWTLAGEAGDKARPSWLPAGGKVLYVRTLGPYTICCAKGTSAASYDALDPGGGTASAPRWLPDGRVLYRYAGPLHPPGFYLQEPKPDAPRVFLPLPDPLAGDAAVELPTEDAVPAEPATNGARDTPAAPAEGEPIPAAPEEAPAPLAGLVEPTRWAFPVAGGTGANAELTGLLYRRADATGRAPAVVVLGDGPPAHRGAAVRPAEQALAAAGFVVCAPNLRGTPGTPSAVTEALRTGADAEVEAGDLADLAGALREFSGVDGERLALVGRGFGGTLALLAEGGRPDNYRAVVAIDPVTDWDREFDGAGGAWRAWLVKHLGLPAAHRARYGLRTPATFVGLVQGPLLLLGSADAPAGRAAQLDALAATLEDLGVPYERDHVAAGEPEAATYARVAVFLRRAFGG